MSLTDYKITDGDVSTKGVIAAPDKLSGTAAQNKAVFDRLIREAVKVLFNGLIDALSAETGASEIGSELEGVTGADNVQGKLAGLKSLVDARETIADAEAAFALKEDKSVTAQHIKAVSFNALTGVFTFTKENGSTVTIDTALEKVATNWTYDETTQSLVLTLADGTTQSVPLSAFITETEFNDSSTIDFSVSNHVVTATVKAGSITDSMLSSALIAQLQGYVSAAAGSATTAAGHASTAETYKTAAAGSATAAAQSASDAAASKVAAGESETAAAGSAAAAAASEQNAEQSEENAGDSAEDSEAWAVGKRGGHDVQSDDETYHNNARYWAEKAETAAGGGVLSFNGRAGHVSPMGGDYTAAMVGAVPSTAKGVAGGVASLGGDGKVPSGQLPAMNYTKLYYKHFTTGSWSNKTLTIQAQEHGIVGEHIIAQFSGLNNGAYSTNVWNAIESSATIDASTKAITLHCETPYEGIVLLIG